MNRMLLLSVVAAATLAAGAVSAAPPEPEVGDGRAPFRWVDRPDHWSFWGPFDEHDVRLPEGAWVLIECAVGKRYRLGECIIVESTVSERESQKVLAAAAQGMARFRAASKDQSGESTVGRRIRVRVLR